MARLSALLRGVGLSPEDCTLLLHSPSGRVFRDQLPGLAITRPDLFEAYQSYHSQIASGTLRNRRYTLSFIATNPVDLVFIGLYAVRSASRSLEWQVQHPALRELDEIYGVFPDPFEGREFFELQAQDLLAELRGRLIIRPHRTRTYVRLLENADPEIAEIASESVLDAPPPPWREWVLTGPEVRTLTPARSAKLAEWRGIYLIVDVSDGARYVGSAYGEQNLLGRWRTHVAADKGVTVELEARAPRNFRFSVLERVSPDMPPEDVIALEQTWMVRLDTRRFGLNR